MREGASEIFRRRLRELRREMGVTQEQLAEKAGLNYKHYQEIERGGKREVRLSTIECLAKAFGVQIGELFTDVRFAENPDGDEMDDEWTP